METHQYRDTWNSGQIRRLTYTIPEDSAEASNAEICKYANVYLPYGYDEEKKYPVLYLIHGGGGNPDAWLDDSKIKNALDEERYDDASDLQIEIKKKKEELMNRYADYQKTLI